MKNQVKLGALSGAALLALAALGGCAANEVGVAPTEQSSASGADAAADSNLSGELIGAGASSQGAAEEAWIAAFQSAHPGVTVNYDPAGSGAGRETFQQGASAFAGSDRAFKLEEIEAGPFQSCAPESDIVELPVYISPIALIFNIEGVDSLNLDAATVAKIFTGQITKWDDPAIAEHNPGVKLPSTNITAVHRSDDSGTTGNFTDYLSAAAPSDWTVGSIETWPTEFGGEGAQGTSGVVEAVSRGIGTIGYADASRAGELGTVALKVGEEYVSYSPESAAAVLDASPLEPGRTDHDLAIDLDRTTDQAGVYPLVLVSYLIACQDYPSAETADLVSNYLAHVVSAQGQEAAASAAGSAPISEDLRAKLQTAISAIGAK